MATAYKDTGAVNTEPQLGRRQAPRARVQVNAILETTTGAMQVVIRNLSRTGAMLEGSNLPKANREAFLKRGEIDAMGVVVWSQGDRCGFQFFDPITDGTVVDLARTPPEPVAASPLGPDLAAGVSDVISVDDWRFMKDRSDHPYRPFRGFS